MSARIAKFEILDVIPRQAAPLGLVTLSIQGTVFPEVVTAKLRETASKVAIHASKTFRFSSQELYATFDLSVGEVGSNFDLILNDELEFPAALEIIPGIRGTVEVSVNNPRRLRPGEVAEITVDVQNAGNTDVLTPLLSFSVTEPAEIRLLGASRPDEWVSSHLLLVTPPRGPGGILPPGSSSRLFFQVRTTTGGRASVEMAVSVVSPNDPDIPNLFAEDSDLYRPFMFSDDRWNRVWESFLEVTGTNHQTFIQQMSAILNHLSIVGQRPQIVEDVVLHQINIVDGFGYYSAQTLSYQDIASHPRERSVLDLEVTRDFDPQLSFRGVRGAFGMGWRSFWWNMKIVNVSEDAIILEQDNQYIEFVNTENSDVYESPRGIITVNDTEMVYSDALASISREVTFNSSSYALIQITAGDGTTLTFDTNKENQPVSVTTSSGYSISVSYNTFDLVESITLYNREGIPYQTARYNYDNSGTFLTSVTVDEETVYYSYEGDGALSSFTDSRERRTTFTYNVFGVLNSVSRFDSAGEIISQSEINDFQDGRVIVSDYPSGRSTDVIYTMIGDVGFSHTVGYQSTRLYQDVQRGTATVLIGDHIASMRIYDPSRNVHHIHDGNGDVTEVSQNELGQLNYFVDGTGNRYNFSNSADERVRTLTYPDGSTESIATDENGSLLEQRNRAGTVSSFLVDEDGLVIQRVDAGEDEYFFMYNERGSVTEASNSVGTVRITYTSTGKPRTVEYPDGNTFVYDYDDRGRRIALRDGGDYHISFTYDARDRVVQVRRADDPATSINMEYDMHGRLSKKMFPNGCESMYTYRQGSPQVEQVINSCSESVISQFDYGYNQRELRTEINSTSGAWTVRYDGAGQVVSWIDPNGNEVNIGYDRAGNRLFLDENGDRTSYTVNELNQYTQVGDSRIRHDECGNVVEIDSPTGISEYEYNAHDQLVASRVDGEECLYRYNAMGALHAKSCSGVETLYYMDFFGDFGSNVLVESSGGSRVEYLHSPGVGLLSRSHRGSTHYYNFDGTGSVVEVFDAAGNVISSHEYDPFGSIIAETGQDGGLFQFSGQFGVLRIHEARLNSMRTRMYNEHMGRFISPDVFGYRGSPTNLYAYANNNPLLYADPTGTIPLAIFAPALISGALSVGAYATATLVTGGEFSVGGFVGSFVGGAVTGIPAVSALNPFVSGAIGGAISDAVTQLIDNDRLSDFDFGRTLGNSILSGAINRLIPSKDFASNLGKILKRFTDSASKFIGKLIKTFTKKGVQGILDYLEDRWNDFLDWILSIDPNDILGPSGFGEARFVKADTTLDYRIRFENDVNATAPAQLVTIETSLDDNVDIATFQLGSFGFGNFTFEVTARSAILQTTIQFGDRDYVVRVTAGLDFIQRKARWALQTLDPGTGLPPADPGIGFLPPNPENGTDGEGFVTYSIRPIRKVRTYDVIDAEARIIFDKNDPIDTDPTFNTIDRDPPSTHNVSIIDDVIDSGILALSIQSTDEGAGVRSLNVFSDDNGKMTLVSSHSATERNVVLDLPSGYIYNLVVLPEDNVGNVPAIARVGTPVSVFFPRIEASCAGVNNCSGFGNCTSDDLCQCIEGRYGNDCSQETPPKEPPIIGVSPTNATEDGSLPFPITVQVVSPTSDDVIELRLVGILESFTSNIGSGDGNDVVIPIEESGDIVLQPVGDIAGEFTITVNATVTDVDGVTLSRLAEVPVFITAVADAPSVVMEDMCYIPNPPAVGNVTVTLKVNVSSGDMDYSEVLSVFISDPWDNSTYAGVFRDIITTRTQVAVDVVILETRYGATLEVRVRATSVEKTNGDQATLDTTFQLPPCQEAPSTTESADKDFPDLMQPFFFG